MFKLQCMGLSAWEERCKQIFFSLLHFHGALPSRNCEQRLCSPSAVPHSHFVRKHHPTYSLDEQGFEFGPLHQFCPNTLICYIILAHSKIFDAAQNIRRALPQWKTPSATRFSSRLWQQAHPCISFIILLPNIWDKWQIMWLTFAENKMPS